MADDVTRDFILEQFRENRELHARAHDRLDRMERRLDAVESHMGTLIRDEFAQNAENTELERRSARVEARLNIRDADA